MKPTYFKFAFPETDVEAVSAKLILSYKGTYGDQNLPQTWIVKEVTEKINWDSAYSVTQGFATGSALSAPTTINIPTLTDSIHDGFEDAANQIRIDLSHDFAKRFIEDYDFTENMPYVSDSLFQESFKGFAVMPFNGQGNALLRVNLVDTNTKLALFYRFKDTASNWDTAVTYFRFSNGSVVLPSAHANTIHRDFSGTVVQSSWDNVSGNTPNAYIETAPGTSATIKIPGLDLFPNAIIHRAELLVFQDTLNDNIQDVLLPPSFLLLSSYDSTKNVKTNIANDFVVSSGVSNLQSFGGYRMQKNITGYGVTYAYTFDVTRYVQGIVTRHDSNKTLRLSAPVNDSLFYSEPYPLVSTPVTFYIQPGNSQ